MSRNMVDKKAPESKPRLSEPGQIPCTFESRFVSIAGSRLEVENEGSSKTSYALATNALLTCDGKVIREESLKAGKEIRVTTQIGNPNMVTSIEWLNRNSCFPLLKAATAK